MMYRLFLILILSATFLFGQTTKDFAHHLFQEKDYFRAISIYKELYFYSQDLSLQNHYLLQISRAYNKGHKFNSAIHYLSKLLNRTPLEIEVRDSAMIQLGLAYYGLNINNLAANSFRQIRMPEMYAVRDFYLALLKAERGNFRDAGMKFTNLSTTKFDAEFGRRCSRLAELAEEGEALTTRNPTLAWLMSLLIPGSGQLYSKHYYDGIQALMYVGALGYATYASYQYENKFAPSYVGTAILGSITAVFHVGNILGANKTAQYYNYRQKEKVLKKLREEALGEF